ncbi:MAG: hypothetical protein IJN37_03755 [Clostridia bacterium]|nr:hypothetical protein [Clostridia bacterium]
MKKILVDTESASSVVAVFGREDGEVIECVPSGVEVINTRNENPVYDILERDFNVIFCRGCKREDFQFYTVPRLSVFATDSFENAIGTLWGAGDISDDDYPVAMVSLENNGYILANSLKDFLFKLVSENTDIREKYGFSGFIPTENKKDNGEYLAELFSLEPSKKEEEYEFEVFASKEEAEKKYEFFKVE